MGDIFRIAVLSDLHFSSSEKKRSETHIYSTRPKLSRQHPYYDLITLIEAEGLKADVVVCPGDITLQADSAALKEAWAAINDIASKLGTGHAIAATGNHDVASRASDSTPEIWEELKRLVPKYPYSEASRDQWLSYWAQHFLIAEVSGVRFVSLNTCNSHARGESEYERGRVTDYTIDTLLGELKAGGEKLLNVLVCHHHPMKHPELSERMLDYSDMTQGAKLLAALESSEQSWVVIHGHKHSPRIHSAQGNSNDAPLVFSAGSFGAVLSPAYFPAGTPNQFYILEFDVEYVEKNGKAGVVNSWDWVEGNGWQPATGRASGIPRILTGSGFGYRANPAGDAASIHNALGQNLQMSWSEVEATLPWTRYLTEPDLRKILKIIEREHKVEVQYGPDSHRPIELLRGN